MLEEILNIRKSLAANFSSSEDGYTRKMFRFSADAEEQLRDVRDGILNAEKQLRDVQTYYCEGEEMARPMQSQDFFGIFRTFTSSYKVSFFGTAGSVLMIVLSRCKSGSTGTSRSARTTCPGSCCPYAPSHR
jgi:cytokinesis protein